MSVHGIINTSGLLQSSYQEFMCLKNGNGHSKLAFVKSSFLILLAKLSSLVGDKLDVRNPKTMFSCHSALTNVMSTCIQLIIVNPCVLA